MNRRIVDISMAALLPLLMCYSVIGETFHEIAGIAAFGLFLLHNVLNRKWWSSLLRGRYTPVRTARIAVNLLLAGFMIVQPLTGILMSRHILVSVTTANLAAVRQIHLCLAYWGLLIAGIHAGMHMSGVLAENSGMRRGMMLAAAYGCYGFVKRRFVDYLFLRELFVFLDYGHPVRLAVDYLTVMILFQMIGAGFMHVLER